MGTRKSATFSNEAFPSVRLTDDIATAIDSPRIAVVEHDGTVTIWDLNSERRLTQFISHYDGGGKRLAISGKGNLCAVGAFQRYGVTLHETLDGSVVWTRRDLKRVQSLKFGMKREVVLAGIDEGAFHIIEASSGDDVKTLRGAKELWENPHGGQFFLEMRSRDHEIVDFDNPDMKGVIKRSNSSVLDVTFGPNRVAVSEVAGPTTIYALNGEKVIWKNSELGSHNVRLSFLGSTDELIAINRNFEGGGSSIIAFDGLSGRVNRRIPIDNDMISHFAMNGSRVVTSQGNIINTLNGEIVSHLDFR